MKSGGSRDPWGFRSLASTSSNGTRNGRDAAHIPSLLLLLLRLYRYPRFLRNVALQLQREKVLALFLMLDRRRVRSCYPDAPPLLLHLDPACRLLLVLPAHFLVYFRDRLLLMPMMVIAHYLLLRLRLHQHHRHFDPLRPMYFIRTPSRQRSRSVARLELLQWRGMPSASVRTMRIPRWQLLFLTRVSDREF